MHRHLRTRLGTIGLLCAWLCLAGPAAAEPRRFALVIGANSGDRSEVVLRFAHADAGRVQETLRQVGQFHSEDMILITGGSAEDVRRAAIDLNARIRQEAGETLLFIFYSGHADAEALHLGGSRLAISELRGLLAGSPAGARVLVVDACRSGAITRVKGGRPGPAFDVRLDAPVGALGMAILTSSAAGEDSQESDQLGGSFFTHYLTSGLIGAADANGDGSVTLTEAYAYAAERTLSATVGTVAGPQHPTYRVDLGGRDDLVLTWPRALGGPLGVLHFVQPGWYLVGRRDGAVLAEVQSQSAGRRLTLEAGQYKITRRERDGLLEGEVAVVAGGTTNVDTDRMRHVAYATVVRKGTTERRGALSLFAGAGVRTEMLGLGTAPLVLVGARYDLRSVFFELRARLAASLLTIPLRWLESHDLSLAVVIGRSWDLRRLTLSAGALAGINYIAQTYIGKALDGHLYSADPILSPGVQSFGAEVGAIGQAHYFLGRGGRFYVQLEPSISLLLFRHEGPNRMPTKDLIPAGLLSLAVGYTF